MGAVVRQVHFSWRADAEGFRGGHSTYAVRADREGLSLTPYHHDPRSLEKARSAGPVQKGTPFLLGTPRLTRGGRSLTDARAATRTVESDGHLALARGGVTEHLRNGEEGVEQSWTFEKAPSGSGELLVEIEASGLEFVDRSPGGLHFADAATGLGFRYGHATWVDASGRRTSLEARFHEGRIQLRVPDALLEDSAYPAVLDPVIAPEMGLGQPVLGPQVLTQSSPVASAVGSTWLVVWTDAWAGGSGQLTAARVSSEGTLLDPTGIAVRTAGSTRAWVKVSGSATDWLIVWQSANTDIQGARVSSAGVVLDATDITLVSTTDYEYKPAVASSGSGWFLVWEVRARLASTALIKGLRLSSTAQPLGNPISLNLSGLWAINPQVSFNGSRYLVVWQALESTGSNFDIRGTRVSTDGTVLDSYPLTLCTATGNQREATLAASGSSWLVAWTDERDGASRATIHGNVVYDSGAMSVTNGQLLALSLGTATLPSVAAMGWGEWFLVWQDAATSRPDIFGTRVGYDGRATGSRVVLANDARSETSPWVASGAGGSSVLVVWEEARKSMDIHGARVSSSGVNLDPAGLLLSKATNRQYVPAVAHDGTHYLVVWRDTREGEMDIYGTRVTNQGVVLDGAGLALGTASGVQDEPTVSAGASGWLVAWEDYQNGSNAGDIRGVKLSREGLVQFGFLIDGPSANMVSPALSFDGTDWYAVWADGRSQLGGQGWDIYGAKISSKGSVTPATGTLLTPGVDREQFMPAIAFNGTEHLVVWREYVRYSSTDYDIMGTRITRAGVAQPLGGFYISSAPGEQSMPVVASAGADWFVAWRDGRPATSLRGARVSSTGVVLDPSGLSLVSATESKESLSLTSDGRSHFLVWQERSSTGNVDVRGMRVRPDGTVLDAPFSLASAAENEVTPAVAAQGTSEFLVLYQRLGVAGSPTAERVVARKVLFNRPPVAAPLTRTTPEDTSVLVTLTATDADLEAMTYSVATPPASGTLSGTPPNLTYSPNADFHGEDRFTYRATDASGESSAETQVVITVTPVADAPVGVPFEVSGIEDSPLALPPLEGRDPDGDALSIEVATQPSWGVLEGTAGALRYVPAPDFHGEDGFTFIVRDATGLESVPVRVRIIVAPVNDAPVAHSRSASLDQDTGVDLVLSGVDVDGDALTFQVDRAPAHGTLSGVAPNLRYVPAARYHGDDDFIFRVHDGQAWSSPAVVRLDVRFVNTAPVAQGQAVSLAEDASAQVVLAGQDVDGDALTFELVGPPAHGVLSGTPPALTYTPVADFQGEDRFTFIARDSSGAASTPATVVLTVTDVNDAPVARDTSVGTEEDVALAVTLDARDVDGDALTFQIDGAPAHGTLSGAPPEMTYTPAQDFHGEDSFTFTVSDGTTSSSATVSLTVQSVNDAPVAVAQERVLEPVATTLTLEGSDVDGDALTFAIQVPPEHGTLEGTPPEVIFTPEEGFRGTTSFTFTVSDGERGSEPATVTLRVGNSAPVVAFNLATPGVEEGEPVQFEATAADANGDALTFHWDFGDGETSEDLRPVHAYANEGRYEVVVSVSDGLATVTRSRTLEVRNAAPELVPLDIPARAEEGRALAFRARAEDAGRDDTLTLTWDFGDGSAPVSGAEASHTYADDGTYTVKVTARDDAGAFVQEVREVQVSNLPPVPVAVSASTLQGGEVLTLQLEATDAAGAKDPLTWSLVEGPGAVTEEGLYSWSTEATTDGHFPVRVRVTDDEGGAADLVLDVRVTALTSVSTSPRGDGGGGGCAASPGSLVLSAGVLSLLAARRRRR
ncbi:PKD domain-containing protein [Myxococcus landrumensis]|uniref:Tandem-95 repeat protein n=1 Tax=Myxococcus landrumensis TaxID=2813577 RepID=A0ABX7N5Y4_9BACT|nr:PKD domain-containing protein [Myxococcus landrumus]QSQ14187.1 tandem-95 repeat protein [Myxococcus landrumus]